MPHAKSCLLKPITLAIALGISAQSQASSDDDALKLEAAPAAESSEVPPLRLAIELGLGRLQERNGSWRDGHRSAIDLRYTRALAQGLKLGLSNRLDDVNPVLPGQHSSRNSLREAYLAWQLPDSDASLQVGRINLRNGPAFGYNPTDFFRSGALQVVTTADPVALRENRLGTVMLNWRQPWAKGELSLVLAPKIDSAANNKPWSLNLAATNPQNRALFSATARISDRVSGQGLALFQEGRNHKIGASLTALASDAVVVYGEWSAGKAEALLQRATGVGGGRRTAHQVATGLSYTLPGGWAITAEAEFNGAGLDRANWTTLQSQGAAGYQRLGLLTQPDLELSARHAWLLYASKKGLGLTQLDFTGFVRQNAVDHSTMAWAELRYHWPRFDLALQWQRATGRSGSEYHSAPISGLAQLLAVAYF